MKTLEYLYILFLAFFNKLKELTSFVILEESNFALASKK